MISKHIQIAAFLLVLCLFLYYPVIPWWRLRLARKRMVKTVRTMAETGRNEIGGQPVEYWLRLLNQFVDYPIIVHDTTVLAYENHDFLFLHGALSYVIPGKHASFFLNRRTFFLVAVGQPAVRLLSEQEHLFRRIIGSDELALFSIFRWSEFTDSLISGGLHRKTMETRVRT